MTRFLKKGTSRSPIVIKFITLYFFLYRPNFNIFFFTIVEVPFEKQDKNQQLNGFLSGSKRVPTGFQT